MNAFTILFSLLGGWEIYPYDQTRSILTEDIVGL